MPVVAADRDTRFPTLRYAKHPTLECWPGIGYQYPRLGAQYTGALFGSGPPEISAPYPQYRLSDAFVGRPPTGPLSAAHAANEL